MNRDGNDLTLGDGTEQEWNELDSDRNAVTLRNTSRPSPRQHKSGSVQVKSVTTFVI